MNNSLVSAVKTGAVLSVLGSVLCASAAAQVGSDLYYEDLDVKTKSEFTDFVQMYVHLLETGEVAEGADSFQYTLPEANSTLFSPYLGYVQTLAGIHAQGQEFIGDDVSPGMVESYAVSGLVTTPLTDTVKTASHLESALASGPDVVLVIEDGMLVSSGIGAADVVSGAAPFVSSKPAPDPQDWMDDLSSFTTNFASGFDHSADVQRLLMGQATNAEELMDEVQEWLEVFVPDDQDLATDLIYATFGKFGALPSIIVLYEDGYLLVNGMTGSVYGPYLHEDEINPGGLLGETPQFNVSTSFSNVNASVTSVGVLAVRRWTTVMPAGYALTPPGSCSFVTTIPGCWIPVNNYECQVNSRGKCVCKANGSISNAATGGTGTAKITCEYPSTDGECSTNAAPPTPIPGASCTTRYKLPR